MGKDFLLFRLGIFLVEFETFPLETKTEQEDEHGEKRAETL